MNAPILVQAQYESAALVPGRYWIGDAAALGYWIGQGPYVGYCLDEMLANVDRYDLEGLYVDDGLVTGTFSRSLWEEADYMVEALDIDIDTTDLKGIHLTGPGVTILPVDDEQITRLSALPRTPWASGLLFEIGASFRVKRIGYNGGDIHLETLGGSGIMSLYLYNRDAGTKVS